MQFWLFWWKLSGLVLRDVRRQKSVSSSPLSYHSLTALWPQTWEFSPTKQFLPFSADTKGLSYDLTQSAWR